jgi:Domain of unknown function (DU1801)
MVKTKPTTITEYINSAPKEGQKNLLELYAILKKAAPEATESIKWGSPVFEEKRILFAFAAFKSHLNFMSGGCKGKRSLARTTADGSQLSKESSMLPSKSLSLAEINGLVRDTSCNSLKHCVLCGNSGMLPSKSLSLAKADRGFALHRDRPHKWLWLSSELDG